MRREDVAIPPFTCVCGYLIDSSTPSEGKSRPNEGALSACIGCGVPLVFGPGLQLRLLSHDEFVALGPADAFELGRVCGAILSLARKK
jgi:hypothetical protein